MRTYQWMILYHIGYNDKHYITNCWFLFIHYLIRRILQGKTLPTNSPLVDILLITVQCTSLDSFTMYIFICGHFKNIWIEFQKFTYNVQAKETHDILFIRMIVCVYVWRSRVPSLTSMGQCQIIKKKYKDKIGEWDLQ